MKIQKEQFQDFIKKIKTAFRHYIYKPDKLQNELENIIVDALETGWQYGRNETMKDAEFPFKETFGTPGMQKITFYYLQYSKHFIDSNGILYPKKVGEKIPEFESAYDPDFQQFVIPILKADNRQKLIEMNADYDGITETEFQILKKVYARNYRHKLFDGDNLGNFNQ